MTEQQNYGPQYPAQGGAKISGDPARSVAAQGTAEQMATCDPVHSVTEESAVGSRAIASETSTGSNPRNRPRSELSLPRETRKPKGFCGKDEAGLSDIATDVESEDQQAGACAGPSKSKATLVHARRALRAGTAMSTGSGESGTEGAPEGETAEGKRPPKRTAGKGLTPPESKKKAKKQKKAFGESFKQATKNELLGVVVAAEDPVRILTANQIAIIRSELMKRLGEVITSRSAPVPRFQESGVIKGRFQLACNDPESFAWLKQTVADITLQIGDSEPCALKLVLPSELPKLRRAEVFIPGTPASVPDVLIWLKAQNPGLKTDNWQLRFRTPMPKGQLLVWGIDPASVALLEGMGNQVFYGLGRVSFRVSQEQTRADERND